MFRVFLVVVFCLVFTSASFAQQSPMTSSQEDKEIQALDWEYRYCLERLKSIQTEYRALMEKRQTQKKLETSNTPPNEDTKP
jgi:hypothetical protein